MAITRERLQQSFSEGGAQEIYLEVKQKGDFLGFAKQYVFDDDVKVARSALWGLTKAKDEELAELKPLFNTLVEQAMRTENPSVRRLTLSVIERMKMEEEDIRTDFLDFCFEHLVKGDEYSGVQTLCMKLAYRMCQPYPELMDELKRILEAMEIDYYKPAVKGLRTKMLCLLLQNKTVSL